MTLLKVQNLSLGYPVKKERRIIAQAVNFNLERGKLISLIGANGAGKSTLLKTLTKLIKPLAGTVFLNDKNLMDFNAQQLAQQLSVVLTEKLPPSQLKVSELVALGRQPHTNWLGTLTSMDHSKIEDAMRLTGIWELRDRKHQELSDGQLQRVLIARAIAQDTPLIILDEPTTHLDILHKVNVFKLLKKLAAETGKCILLSTHDLDLSLQLSDELLVLEAGTITQGKVPDLIANGVLQKLFNSAHIHFDEQTLTYRVL